MHVNPSNTTRLVMRSKQILTFNVSTLTLCCTKLNYGYLISNTYLLPFKLIISRYENEHLRDGYHLCLKILTCYIRHHACGNRKHFFKLV